MESTTRPNSVDLTTDARRHFLEIRAQLVGRYAARVQHEAIDVVHDVALVLWGDGWRLAFDGPESERTTYVQGTVARLCRFALANYLRKSYRRRALVESYDLTMEMLHDAR